MRCPVDGRAFWRGPSGDRAVGRGDGGTGSAAAGVPVSGTVSHRFGAGAGGRFSKLVRPGTAPRRNVPYCRGGSAGHRHLAVAPLALAPAPAPLVRPERRGVVRGDRALG